MKLLIQNKSCSRIDINTKTEKKVDNAKIRYIIKRKLRQATGKRYLGPAWLILDPLIMASIYLFIFTVLRARIEPSSIFIGVTLYKVLQSSFMSGVNSLKEINGSIKCVRVSSPVLLKAGVAHMVVDTLLQTIPTALLLGIGFDVHWPGTLSYILTALIMASLFFGIGMSVSGPLNKIPDINSLVKYILMVGFYVSPSMIPMHKMSNPLHFKFNEYNPFSYFVEFIRYSADLTTPFADLDLKILAVIMVVMLLLTVVGVMRFDKLRWRMTTWS